MWWEDEYQLFLYVCALLGILILLMTCCCFIDIIKNYKKWKNESDQNMKPLVEPLMEEI